MPGPAVVPAGQDVAITLTTTGASAHNDNIDELHVHTGDCQAGQLTVQ